MKILEPKLLATLFSVLFIFSPTCSFADQQSSAKPKDSELKSSTTETLTAVFAGGCFWCLEAAFDKVEGVTATISGYAGGSTKNPNYKQVSMGVGGHAEVVKLSYEPQKISYRELLEIFWRNIDPFDSKGQFCDKGVQYRSAIFYEDETQRSLAEQSLKKVSERFGADKKIATKLEKLDEFYPAEEYHQNYHTRNPIRYKAYSVGCGRARKLESIWESN